MNELNHLATIFNSTALSLNNARSIHSRLIKFYQNYSPDSCSPYNKLLKLYSQTPSLHYAHKLFETMPSKDVASFNMLISTHLRINHDFSAAFRLYHALLHEGFRPNSFTFATLLGNSKAWTGVFVLEQMHCHTVKFGLNSNGFVGSTLVNCYEKLRGLNEAMMAFEEIHEVDSVSWNVMIDACARSGSKAYAVSIFERMRKESDRGVDCFTLTSVLKTCTGKEDLSLGQQLHACGLKSGLEYETPIGNSLITMYSRCGDEIRSALFLFRNIHDPNIVSWTAIISALTQKGLAEEAIRMYTKMVKMGHLENEFLFASILPAFGALSTIMFGRMVHSRLIKTNYCKDVEAGNALIDMYFKCGDLNDAKLVFATMMKHDIVSWTIMINALGQHGRGNEALCAFEKMRREGYKPDSITFLNILSSCNHCGLVDEGICMLQTMTNDYGIKPGREHFASLVDMLGRAGRLSDAETFIEDMKLDSYAWESLLNACRIHGEMQIGERAAKRVMKLEPQKEGPYVQLSNIYAGNLLWENKGEIRKRMDDSRYAAASTNYHLPIITNTFSFAYNISYG